jgi:flavin reductase (DIM6/NTAB) family NADH-FMN oxidoreductase RutF
MLTSITVQDMELDPRKFRNVLSKFATGVTVVTTRFGSEIHGLTVNAFCSVSLEPMLVLVCIDKESKAHALLEHSKNYAVNFLAADQEDIARRFSTDQLSATERFADILYRREATGAPVFESSLGFLDCEIVSASPAGDHTIFIGRVVALGEQDDCHPLLYFKSAYKSLLA